jgi:hypothetical protein
MVEILTKTAEKIVVKCDTIISEVLINEVASIGERVVLESEIKEGVERFQESDTLINEDTSVLGQEGIHNQSLDEVLDD